MQHSTAPHLHTLCSLVATGALLWGAIAPAHATDAGDGARTRQVSLADLDLSTIAGQTAARQRLHRMARELCGELADELDLSHQTNFVQCVEQATAQTLPPLEAMIRHETALRPAAIARTQP